MSVARLDPVAIVEAAYALDGDDQAWLRRIAELVGPAIDRGDGVVAYFYDTTRPASEWIERTVLLGGSADFHAALDGTRDRTFKDAPPFFLNLMHTTAPLYATGETFMKILSPSQFPLDVLRKSYRAFGFEDSIALRTSDGSGRGLLVNALWRRAERIDRRTQAVMTSVATHLAAGLRLRRAARNDAAETEAILRPDGRVEDATGEAASKTARELLRDAVRRQDTARGSREDPERALELWRGLEAGRWSLVDHFERDGRRYLVARRNAVEFPDPRALTARERQVVKLAALGHGNKLIAYELGLSVSTVANQLASALRKLGLRSRLELIRWAGDGGTP